jgi:uncharacterized protein YigA (DUF484 family)
MNDPHPAVNFPAAFPVAAQLDAMSRELKRHKELIRCLNGALAELRGKARENDTKIEDLTKHVSVMLETVSKSTLEQQRSFLKGIDTWHAAMHALTHPGQTKNPGGLP